MFSKTKSFIVYAFSSLLFMVSCYQPEITSSLANTPITDTIVAGKTIRVSGSTTIHPLMSKIVAHFTNTNQQYKFDITSSGSKEGIADLYKDATDIAMSSHIISTTERSKFRTNNMEYVEFMLAGDALVFIANVNNPIKKLTNDQLVAIFTGKIHNWNELGGENAEIRIVSRDTNSGTYSFLKEEILQSTPLYSKAKIVKSNDELFKSVINDHASLGYTSFSTLDYSVEPMNVSFDQGKTYVNPRVETVNNLTYKYFRGLYLYYKPSNYQKIKPFMDLIKTDTIKGIIKQNGYIPINNALISKN
jgi:phosphate transport system substrate-binding protein